MDKPLTTIERTTGYGSRRTHIRPVRPGSAACTRIPLGTRA